MRQRSSIFLLSPDGRWASSGKTATVVLVARPGDGWGLLCRRHHHSRGCTGCRGLWHYHGRGGRCRWLCDDGGGGGLGGPTTRNQTQQDQGKQIVAHTSLSPHKVLDYYAYKRKKVSSRRWRLVHLSTIAFVSGGWANSDRPISGKSA